MDRSHRTSLFVLTASLILIAVSGCTVTRSRQTPARTGPDGPKNGNRSVVEKGARTVVDRGPSDRAASRPTLNARVTDGRGGGQSRGSPSRGLERRSPRAPEHAGQQASLRATIRSTDVGGAAAAETGRDHAVEPPRGNMGQGSSKNPPKGPPFAQDDLPGNVAGVPSCEPIADVLCGDVVENDTSFYQDFNSIYDCLPGWLEDGPEIAYRFKTEQVVQVTATLSGLDAGVDLDVFVLTQACVPETCIAFGHVAATFNAVPGTEYFIVVDGYERAAGQFVLTITCATPEICDDGRDNDGDDLVDCVDPDCANDPACASTGACCFDGGCEPGTFREWCESQNGTWHAGLGCADVECPQACCATDGTCSDVLPTTCLEQGDTPQGLWSTCATWNCPVLTGACCDDITGVCNDGTLLTNCQSPLRFAANTPCSQLDPVCGGPVAACCVDGVCANRTESDCTALSGVWFSSEDCTDFTCGNPLVCPATTLYGQLPILPPDAWTFGVSDADWSGGSILRYESFAALNGPICDVHWWGIAYGSAQGECVENPMTFTVKFYENAAAVFAPGTEVCSYTASVTGAFPGWVYVVGDLMEFHLDLPTCCSLSTGWVSIQASGGSTDCWFWWLSSETGDGQSCFDDGTTLDCSGTSFDTSYDLSICLTGSSEPLGACCHEGNCEGVMEEARCLEGGGTWFENEDCDSVVCPPPLEACCFTNLTCAGLLSGLCGDPCPCNPDMNCDGALDSNDVNPFLLAMSDSAAYEAQYPDCELSWADLDCDGDIDDFDRHAFYCVVLETNPPDCIDMDSESCVVRGGVPQGPGTDCTTITCPPSGACCVDGTCTGVMREADCRSQSGTWHEGHDCSTVECGPILCEQSPYPECAGDCPPNETCTPSPTGGFCTCEPIACEQSLHPECAGECPPNEICTPSLTSGICTCEPIPCAQSAYPACGGICPTAMTCVAEPANGACVCEPIPCEPTTDGSACADTLCVNQGSCMPRCMNYNPQTGATSIIDCECRNPNECHITESSPGSTGDPCVVSDNGTGTITLPPAGCEYLSPDEVHEIIDGLPPGTTIELDAIHKDFLCTDQPRGVCSIPLAPYECEARGGSLGGHGDCFDSTLELAVTGTGALSNFNRVLFVPIACEVHTGPRNPGDAVQAFDTKMFRLEGELLGDQDFCTFRVKGGSDNGLPGSGHTTLTRLGPPGSDFAVDSFFDITYEIEFAGCDNSPLVGFAGTTTATLRMQTGSGPGTPSCAGICPTDTVCERTATTKADGTLDLCCDCNDGPPTCGPTRDAQSCEDVVCPVTTDVCMPKVVYYNSQGEPPWTVAECACAPEGACHVAFGAGGPGPAWCEGTCPEGFVCDLIASQPGGIILETAFECRCTPEPTIACCNPNDGTCLDVTEAECAQQGGNSQGAGTICEQVECPQPTVEIDEFDFSIGRLELILPDGSIEAVSVTGSTTVEVYFEGNDEGDAVDDDGNTRDEVQTEMVALNLAGVSPALGPVRVGLNPDIPSTGQIEERVNITTGVLDVPPFGPPGSVADSFFDVFFEIDVDGRKFYTVEPKRMSGSITHKPPGRLDWYEGLADIRLYDENGNPTDYFLGATRHRPRPPVEIDEFDFTLGQLDLILPGGTTETVQVRGPATVAVYFEGDVEGTAHDDGHTAGLDEVVTQMTDLNLTGFSPALGPVHVGLNPDLASMGLIEELANATPGILDIPPFTTTGSADSFFDIYFEVTVGGQKYHTERPKRMSGRISHKPPGPLDWYEGREDIQLFDENGLPTDYYLGATRHRPRPPVEIDEFDFTLGQLDLILPGGTTETVQVTGPATVAVYFEGDVDGTAHDDGHTAGLDEVVTQMTDLNLTGFSPALGPVHVGLNPDLASMGLIEELANATPGILDIPPFTTTGSAESFFDIYFEVTVGDQRYHTVRPKRMSGRISHKPPGSLDWYEGREDIQLFDENGLPTDYYLGATRHRPSPPVEIDEFDFSIGQLELTGPTGTEIVAMTGPATVAVYFEGSVDGDAVDDDGDTRDEVLTEMIALNLTGLSPTLGPVVVRLHPGIPSMGEIEERVDVTTGVLDVPPFGPPGSVADSFFDIFFEVEVAGQKLHTERPKRMSSVIRQKPPGSGALYENVDDIELFDEAGNQTPWLLGATRHRPSPPVEIDEFDFSIGQLELTGPLGTEIVAMTGPATVAVYFEGSVDGDAVDNDGDTRDEVQTEMIALNLTGLSPTLGPVVVRLHPGIPSMGEIEETTNDTPGTLDIPPFTSGGTADSFFDIFFEIEVAGQKLHTERPKRMSSVIRHKPPGPGALYENVDDIELYDENGNQTPWLLGATRHRPRPPVEIDQFDFTFGQLELILPDGTTETVQVTGPATVAVYFEGDVEGSANDDGDGEGLDEVVTQMTDLNLTGFSPALGPVHVRLNPDIPSMGKIEEVVNNVPGTLDIPPFTPTGSANSFFDIYFEVTVAGRRFLTVQPKRMSGRITHKPPGSLDWYEGREDIPLVNEFGFPTGYFLGATRHRPSPPVEIDQFDFSIGELELILPDGSQEIISVNGPTTVVVYFEGSVEGDAADDDGDTREEVVTLVLDLDLFGVSPSLGPMAVRLNPDIPSIGEIEETTNDTPGTLDVPPFTPTGSADSFFDIYFEIEVVGQKLHTETPKRMRSRITHKPPDPVDLYEGLEDIQLFNEYGVPTQFYLGATRHRPRPPCERGDTDGDQDTDLMDYANFHDCLGGPIAGSTSDECVRCLDFDNDDDVDLRDFAVFERLFTGSP